MTEYSKLSEEEKQNLYNAAYAAGRMSSAFEDLQDVSSDTWNLLKKESKKGSKEWISALASMKTIMAGLFNTDISKLSNEFVENHLDQMNKMANGTRKEAAAA
jgi:hypothetical protein